MTRWLPVLLRAAPWLVAALIGWMLWRSHNNSVRDAATWEAERATLEARYDTARADASRDSAAAALASLRASQALRARDSVAVAYRARLANAVRAEAVATQRAVEAGRSVDASVDSVRTLAPVLGDSLRAQVAQERAATRSVAEALREQNRAVALLLASTETALGAQVRRGDALDVAVSSERAARAASDALAVGLSDRLDAVEHPGLFARLRRAVVPLAVGVVVGGVLIGR